MTLKPLPTNLSRFGGCTLTGALSVTTHVRDTVSIVHGPDGCSHHNFSLLHATAMDNDHVTIPSLVSTGLAERDIVFGGEEALARTLVSVADSGADAIFVLSTCIVDTIGDDIRQVCTQDYGVPVIPIPTAGFLGGTFQNGVNNALIALADLAEPASPGAGVNIVGEMNLEFEVESNYHEIERILSNLGIPVMCRFIHDLPFEEIQSLGAARVNILRHPALVPVGEYLRERFGIPFIPSFPLGFSSTLSFVNTVADAYGVDGSDAVDQEQQLQEKIIRDFGDFAGSAASFDDTVTDTEELRAAGETARALRLTVGDPGSGIRLPVPPAVGTSGIRRMLHRWRRSLHA